MDLLQKISVVLIACFVVLLAVGWVRAERKQRRMRAVLLEHHRWHDQSPWYWLVVTEDDLDEKEIIKHIEEHYYGVTFVDDSLEYSDSTLYSRTVEVL